MAEAFYRFADRTEAGKVLAAALKAPLDVWLVRKLGVPGYGELAMGALGKGNGHAELRP
jgi:predicted phosphoribosyltransferase